MPIDRRAYLSVSALFLALIVAPAWIQTVSELRSGERPRALDVFSRLPTGPNLHDFEQSLAKSSLVVRQLRPWTQYMEWRFLADTGEKAVVGRDGWLFYRPSVRYATERAPETSTSGSTDPLAAIRSFHDQLQARRIRLVVVPVPSKESVYPEMLARRADGAGVVVCEQTRRLLDRLVQAGIEYVDLFEAFRRARQEENPSRPTRLYLAHDSHWSPEGARLAARAVAHRVLEGGTIISGDRAYNERSVTVRRHGDLVEMLQVPQIERAITPESLACLQVLEPDRTTPYRDRPEAEVLILGDSFLRIFEQDEPGSAGLIAHLARELGRPLASIVNDGGASTLVRQELARRPTLLLNKKVVIWEFAERDIRYGTERWQIVPLTRSKTTPRQP